MLVWVAHMDVPVTLDEVGQLGPAATALAAVVALVIGFGTLAQRSKADRREQWWKRAQWALDLTLEADSRRRAVGLAALEVLATSELAGKEENRMIQIAARLELDSAGAGGDTDSRADVVEGDHDR